MYLSFNPEFSSGGKSRAFSIFHSILPSICLFFVISVNCFQETINTAEPKHVLEKTSIIPSLDSSANSSRGPTPGDTFTSSDESDYSNNFIIIKGKMNKLNLTVNMDINEQFTSPMNGNERYASPKPAGIFNQLDRNKSILLSIF